MSSAPRIDNLVVFTDVDERNKYRQLPANSTRVKIVEAIVDMALRVLETRSGRQTLIDIATRVVTTLNSVENPQPHIYRRPLAEMPQCIDQFLRKLRQSFPYVYLTMTSGEGAAVRNKDWGDDMDQYDPVYAVTMDLNMVIIDNMIFARQAPKEQAGDTYGLLKFQMIITIAHEICHCLTGYLTGSDRPLTPPTVSLGGYGFPRSGEAGRYLEGSLFGGVVEFYDDKQDPMGRRQAGVPYLMNDGTNNSRAIEISRNYIFEFINGSLTFPIRASSRARPTTRAELKKTSKETSGIRPRQRNRVPKTASPERDNELYVPIASNRGSRSPSAGSTAHRQLPVHPQYRPVRTAHPIVEQYYVGAGPQAFLNTQAYGGVDNQAAYGRPSNQVYGGPGNQVYGRPSNQAYGGPSSQAYGGPSNQAYPGSGGYGWGQSGPRYGH